jgi:DNA replication protein DnaC
MEEIEFDVGRGMERRLILSLAQSEWIGEKLNMLITGATGAGKTYLACALGQAACRHQYSVRYVRTSRCYCISLRLVPMETGRGSYRFWAMRIFSFSMN